MKILMLNYEFPPVGGGAGRATFYIARELVKMGHKIDILTSYCYKGPKKDSIKGVRIYNSATYMTPMLQYAKKALKDKHVGFIQADAVLQYMPVDEKHQTNPISISGASKLAAEKYCQIYNDLLDLLTIILRYHTVYGPRQRPDMAIHKYFKKFWRK